MTESPPTANEQLIKNLETQLERLVEQLNDLEECKSDLTADEHAQMKTDTVDQITEFTATLDRMLTGDVTLHSECSRLRRSIRSAIAIAFNTSETIRLFGEQSAQEWGAQLAHLEEALRLRRIDAAQFERQKVAILLEMRARGHSLVEQDQLFCDKRRNEQLLEQMEQIENEVVGDERNGAGTVE